jgi:photosystem II stability/assembly factor-like uncharacterized protein
VPCFGTKRLVLIVAGLLVAAVPLAAVVFARDEASPRDAGVARGADALLVHRVDAERLLAGTDDGVLESVDGGRSWRRSGLDGKEVVALARIRDGTVWAGGPGFLARSPDGGRSWTEVRPSGLVDPDVRALSGSRDVGGRLEAAIGGVGIFRSNDGGRSFEKLGVSTAGDEATDLKETIDGVIFLSDERLGVVVNGSGDGVEWIEVLDRSVSALAPNYADRHHGLLLAGTDEGVLRTADKGQTWQTVLSPADARAVAFSQSQTHIAYALTRDGTTYRSIDFGTTWTAMG